MVPLEWIELLTVSRAQWAKWNNEVEIESLLKADDALRSGSRRVKVVQFHIWIVNTDHFVRDERLFEAGLVPGQALLLQRVYEFELVNSEITNEARHELLEEFLEVGQILSNELRWLNEFHELLICRLDVFFERAIDLALSACWLCVEQHPSEKAEQAPVQCLDQGEITIVRYDLIIFAKFRKDHSLRQRYLPLRNIDEVK